MYEVTEIDSGIFKFTTKAGLVYTVLFAVEKELFSTLEVKEIKAYEVMVMPDNEDEKMPRDPSIAKTVCKIIIDFINKSVENIVVYVCQSSDLKQNKRKSAFDFWEQRYVKDPSFLRIPFETETVFAAIIFKESNKNKSQLYNLLESHVSDPKILKILLENKGS